MLKITLTENGPVKNFETAVEKEMENHIQAFEKELLKVRTGRAHPSMVEDVKVSSYGAMMSLRELAAISAPEASSLLIQPWDKENIAAIEKALSTTEMGLTPINDGNVIRIQLPKMSSARRDELVKVVGQKLEQTKIALRNVRKEVHNQLRDLEKAKTISEDYGRRVQDSLQKVTDRLVKKADDIGGKKEQELKSL
jgi:ribosome recycling factor